VRLLSVPGWFLEIPQKLRFACFNELATVKFTPDLALDSKSKSDPDVESRQKMTKKARRL
jgi:hypothetical protein